MRPFRLRSSTVAWSSSSVSTRPGTVRNSTPRPAFSPSTIWRKSGPSWVMEPWKWPAGRVSVAAHDTRTPRWPIARLKPSPSLNSVRRASGPGRRQVSPMGFGAGIAQKISSLSNRVTPSSPLGSVP